jgi:hypothetical protein
MGPLLSSKIDSGYRMVKKKKRSVISNAQAIARLEKMIPIIFRNLQNAILIEATMKVGNDIVGEMSDRHFPGARAYNRIMKSLAYDLAMHLARLYDVGSRRKPPNKRNIASIPLALRLLRQKRCKNLLSARARAWNPNDLSLADAFELNCLEAIERASKSYSEAFRGRHGRGNIKTLKEFRDNFMAHSLMNDSEANPIYNHLYRLTECARDFVQDARLAVEGRDDDLKKHERIFADDARRFWRMALLGERDESDALHQQLKTSIES